MRWSFFLLSAVFACAQGTKPKPLATDYEAHGQSGPVDIGAEYMVHSYSAGDRMFLAPKYLVVEVALYPLMKDGTVEVELNKFSLRVNQKIEIAPATAAQAAASLKGSRWNPGRVMGGMGGPFPVPFPGSPQTRPPSVPQTGPVGGTEHEEASPEDVLLETAFPEGEHKGAVSGFLYFPFTGKPSSIKSVELEFGSATLTLK